MHLLKFPSVHAARMERWLGAEMANGIAQQARGWHGDPIPVMGVPGRVFACGDGDYCGAIRGGFYSNLASYSEEKIKRALRKHAAGGYLNTGFSSLSDLISEATGGKMQHIYYQKTGAAKPAAAYCQDLWNKGAVPSAGSNGGAAPGGTVHVKSDAGALPFSNPSGSDTLHITTWTAQATVANAIMIVDRLFSVSLSHNSANTAVTGVPTRYTAPNAKNNFVSARVTTVLTSTAHNITLTYKDQDGNTAEAATAIAARVSAAVDTIPLTTPSWFIPLNAGDTGVSAITNWATSAGNTGVSDVHISHMLALCPIPVANMPIVLDGINSAFNLVEIETDACLMLMEYFATATTATTHTGLIQVVSG